MMEIRPSADAVEAKPASSAPASKPFNLVVMCHSPVFCECCCRSRGSLPMGRTSRLDCPCQRSRWAAGRAERLAAAAVLDGIEEHREHDDRAGEHCLPIGGDADDHETVGEEADDEGAEEGAADI